MNLSTDNPETDANWISHGAIHVLAYLNETDGICSELAAETGLAESSAYRWLTELEEAGILAAEGTRRENGRPVVRYQLKDEALGAAARVIVDQLGGTDTDTGTKEGADTESGS